MAGKAVVIYSGGLDSTTLLYHLRDAGHELKALSVNYRQRHLRREALGGKGRGVRQASGEGDHLRPSGDRHQIPHGGGTHHLGALREQVRISLEVARGRVRPAAPRHVRRAGSRPVA